MKVNKMSMVFKVIYYILLGAFFISEIVFAICLYNKPMSLYMSFIITAFLFAILINVYGFYMVFNDIKELKNKLDKLKEKD